MGLILLSPLGLITPPLFYNTTLSLPRGFYYAVIEDTLSVGDIIRVCAPDIIAPFALNRGYLHEGSCPGGTAPIGKTVVAMAGDTVRVDSTGVFAGTRRLKNSRPIQRDSRGRSVSAASGEYVLQSDECFVLSMHTPKSFDSRYFGPVACSAPYHVLYTIMPRARQTLEHLRREARNHYE